MPFRTILLALLLTFPVRFTNADILITKLDDISVSISPTRARDMRVTERLCVAGNPVTPYSLEAIGSGPNGEFVIANGPFEISYELFLRDRPGSGFRSLLPATPLTGLMSRRLRANGRCPGNAARLRMIIRVASFQGAVTGNYRGSLQLTVIPE